MKHCPNKAPPQQQTFGSICFACLQIYRSSNVRPLQPYFILSEPLFARSSAASTLSSGPTTCQRSAVTNGDILKPPLRGNSLTRQRNSIGVYMFILQKINYIFESWKDFVRHSRSCVDSLKGRGWWEVELWCLRALSRQRRARVV